MLLLRAVTGYRMMNHICNEDIREELRITVVNTIVRIWLEYIERLLEN
jgi:hypothetical protein